MLESLAVVSMLVLSIAYVIEYKMQRVTIKQTLADAKAIYNKIVARFRKPKVP